MNNVDQFKYLGVQLTNTLSWNVHMSKVCHKLGHSIQILRKLKGMINDNDLLIVYTTLVQRHIDYCINNDLLIVYQTLVQPHIEYCINNYLLIVYQTLVQPHIEYCINNYLLIVYQTLVQPHIDYCINNDLLIVYQTLVQPHIDYCITVWGYAPNCHIKKLPRGFKTRLFEY